MVDFAGWEMPLQYSSIRREQVAVRIEAGLFDVSHMGRFDVRGAGAGDFLQGMVTNDLSALAPDTAQYNLLCLPDGGIVDDLVVYHPRDTWSVVVNAANRDKDLSWLRDHAPAGVEVVDRSEEVALIALQGPTAEQLLPVDGAAMDGLSYFHLVQGRVAGVECLISRTGYTGEDGFELFLPSERVGQVWDALVGAGATPCGLAARDVCRLEAGLRLYGSDMDEHTDPYEAGLGWTVKLGKGDFVGRDALRRVKDEGPLRKLVGLACAGRAIPRHGAAVSRGGREIGVVTSGTYSFWLQKGIAMALLDTAAAAAGGDVELAVRSGDGQASIVPLPFYRGSVRQATRSQT